MRAIADTDELAKINPGQPDTWPADVQDHVDRLALNCETNPENSEDTLSCELVPEALDAFTAERDFLEVLDDRRIVLYHATRLLPHEVTLIRLLGLLTLSEEGRDRRLDKVIEQYGKVIKPERLEALRRSGPLARNSVQRSARLGVLYGVTPLNATFQDAGSSMTVFLENWGGESFYGAAYSDEDIAETIRELSRKSTATIVEFSVPASFLAGNSYLWRIFVGQLHGWEGACGEFRIGHNIPPKQILDLLHEDSPRWPREIGVLRTPQTDTQECP